MVVEPIFGGQEVQKAQKTKNKNVQKREDVTASKTGDSLQISDGAKEKIANDNVVDAIKSFPDISRQDRIDAAKQRILGGDYLTPKVVDEIADKIADLLIG